MRKRFKKRTIIIAGSIAVLLIATAVSFFVRSINDHTHAILKDTGYATILPEGRTISDLGGWVRVSPEGTTPVYAYNDTLTDIAISVSEQPLPDSFKTDSVAKVSELAKSYNASATLAIGDVTIYIGTSAKGPQSVIFTKSNLLVI
jgi:hypothetical protein